MGHCAWVYCSCDGRGLFYHFRYLDNGGPVYRAEAVTGEQVKGARALLGWTQTRLALETGLNPSTILEFETGRRRTTAGSVFTIQYALETVGVEFPEGQRPRLKSGGPS